MGFKSLDTAITVNIGINIVYLNLAGNFIGHRGFIESKKDLFLVIQKLSNLQKLNLSKNNIVEIDNLYSKKLEKSLIYLDLSHNYM